MMSASVEPEASLIVSAIITPFRYRQVCAIAPNGKRAYSPREGFASFRLYRCAASNRLAAHALRRGNNLTPFSQAGDYTIGRQKKFKSPIGVIGS
jgi:hypothetical protein